MHLRMLSHCVETSDCVYRVVDDGIGRETGFGRVATRGTASAVVPDQLKKDPEGVEGGTLGPFNQTQSI